MILGEPGSANHGRNKTIERGSRRCDACAKVGPCLMFDSSDDEYGPVAMCSYCLGRALFDDNFWEWDKNGK